MYHESNVRSSVYCFSNKIIRQVLQKKKEENCKNDPNPCRAISAFVSYVHLKTFRGTQEPYRTRTHALCDVGAVHSPIEL